MFALIQEARVIAFESDDPTGRFPDTMRWLPAPELATIDYIEVDGAVVPPSLAYLQDQVKARVTALRWRRESAGFTLANGVKVLTAKDDQDRVNSVLGNMERYGLPEVDFKAASGWVTVTYDEVNAIGAAVVEHVQGCFTAEMLHHRAIDALDSIEAVAAYDYSAGWPTNAATAQSAA